MNPWVTFTLQIEEVHRGAQHSWPGIRPTERLDRKLDPVSEHYRPKSGPIAIVPEPAARPARELDRPEPVPELSLGARVEPHGASQGHARARGTLAIVALMVLFVVGGALAVVRELRTSPPEPRRQDLGRCTEHIERTPHTEYIERTCTRDGS